MANGVRINNLNQATSLNDTDTITIIQDDENKKASISLFDKDGTYTQSVVNTIPDLITTSKANVETTKQAIDEKFGYDKFSAQIVTSQAMSSVGVSDDGSVDVSSQVQDGFMESATLYGKTQYHDTTADVYYDSMPEDTTGMTLELVSVKMPILTTTGKNLWNPKKMFVYDNLIDGTYSKQTLDFLQIGKKYVIKAIKTNKCKDRKVWINYNGENVNGYNLIDGGQPINHLWDGFIYTGAEKLGIYTEGISKKDMCSILHDEYNFFIYENGTRNDVYEPYKSSILSCNEDVTLRKIDNVRDELNLLTSKMTERTGEIVFDGSQDLNSGDTANWNCNGNTIGFYIKSSKTKNNIGYSDKLPLMSDIKTNDTECFYINSTQEWIGIRILKSKLSELTNVGLKAYLEQNPITIQYQLATESVKAIDLNSNNGDVKTPPVYKNGHVLLQSNGLIPELHYSLPISYSGLIAQNTMTNLKHSWRLDELEIMAYTSIVNYQYESLILVATAETNEVVVSSDYVPDESLYNMLKVLVNANALENADEKINVFYLYGKLSDEMYIDLIMGDDM